MTHRLSPPELIAHHCLILACLLLLAGCGQAPGSSGSGGGGGAVHADDGKQQARLDVIEDMKRQGVLVSISHAPGSVTAWVTDEFLRADTRTQNRLLTPIWAYYAIDDDRFGRTGWDFVKVKWNDGTAGGRVIGRYDPVNGIGK